MNTGLWVDGITDDVALLNLASFSSTMTIYPYIVVSNNRGGDTESFDTAILNVPCKVDDEVNGPYPQRAKDNIDVDRIERTIYIPDTYSVKIKDEVETNAGNPTGAIIRYRVLDTILETDETDIALLVEVVS
jgi:hypothetical protein